MANAVNYKGTDYKQGMFVVLEESEDGYVLGKLLFLLIFQGTELFCVVEKCHSVHCIETGLYFLMLNDNDHAVVECVNINSLLDYYPLTGYRRRQFTLLALHHAVFVTIHSTRDLYCFRQSNVYSFLLLLRVCSAVDVIIVMMEKMFSNVTSIRLGLYQIVGIRNMVAVRGFVPSESVCLI